MEERGGRKGGKGGDKGEGKGDEGGKPGANYLDMYNILTGGLSIKNTVLQLLMRKVLDHPRRAKAKRRGRHPSPLVRSAPQETGI